MNWLKIRDAIIIWCSFLALLVFYILQKGKGLEGMEAPFFNQGTREDQYLTNIWLNICSFIFIAAMFAMIYITKLDRSLRSLVCHKSDIFLVSIILVLFIIKGFWSDPAVALKAFFTKKEVTKLLIFEGLAVLSIPCMLYVLSWLREKRETSTSIFDTKRFFYFCVTVAVIGMGVLILYCFSRDNWRDESSTLYMVKNSFEAMIACSAMDVHPPLYYVVAHFAIKIGQMLCPGSSIIYAAKLASMLPLLILVILCITIIRKKWGWYVGGMGAVASVGMPLMLTYAQVVRMYSWSLLWLTCIWLCTYMICSRNRWRDWVGLGVFGVLQVYTQYGYCIAVAPLYIYLFIWSIRNRCIHRWCLIIIGMILAFIPWLLIIQHYSHHILPAQPNWMPKMPLWEFCNMLILPTKDIIALFILGGVWVAAFQRWCKDGVGRNIRFALVGISIPFFYVLLMSTISWIHAPVMVARSRYLVSTLGCMWLGVIIAVHELKLRNLRVLFTLMMIFIAASEINSFSRIRRHGRDGSNAIYHFFEKKSNAVIISNKSTISRSSVSLIAERPLYSIDPIKQPYLQYAIGEDYNQITPEDLLKMIADGKELYFQPHEANSLRGMKAVLTSVGLQLSEPFYHYYKGKTKYAFHRIERIPQKKTKVDKKKGKKAEEKKGKAKK